MTEGLPAYVSIVFLLTTLATVGFLLYALWTGHRRRSLIYISAAVLAIWMYFQVYLADIGFYSTFDGKPRFLLAVGPPLLLIISLFAFRRTREFLAALSLPALTILSVVRIPVELCIDAWY